MTTTIIDAMRDPNLFGPWFSGSTWNGWFTFLKALFALPLDEDEAIIYERHAKRTTAPQQAFREAWLVVGRRGGKSLIAAVVAVFLACFRDYSAFLKPGEVGTVMVLAADRKQARVIMRYVKGFFDSIPMLRRMVVNETVEGIELSNRVAIEISTASFRATRGYTLIAVIADEVAFWRSDESANPDTEILSALRPGMATIPGALLLAISSPYARRGAMWEAYKRYFGKEDERVLIWKASTREMNSSVDQRIIEDALAEDESAARAEYFAEFRTDVESFVSREAIAACVVPGRLELPPVSGVRYTAFTDPSGGSSDSFTLSIAHEEERRSKTGEKFTVIVVDAVRERKPPFNPENVIQEFAELLRLYRVRSVKGDRYGGEFPRSLFSKYGISYMVCDSPKSDLYMDLLPRLNSGQVELLDNQRLIAQLSTLERRTSRSGKDSIDHGPGGAHDDLINSAAGAIAYAGGSKRRTVGMRSAIWTDNGLRILPEGINSIEEYNAAQQHEAALKKYYANPDPLTAASLFSSDHPEFKRWYQVKVER